MTSFERDLRAAVKDHREYRQFVKRYHGYATPLYVIDHDPRIRGMDNDLNVRKLEVRDLLREGHNNGHSVAKLSKISHLAESTIRKLLEDGREKETSC